MNAHHTHDLTLGAKYVRCPERKKGRIKETFNNKGVKDFVFFNLA